MHCDLAGLGPVAPCSREISLQSLQSLQSKHHRFRRLGLLGFQSLSLRLSLSLSLSPFCHLCINSHSADTVFHRLEVPVLENSPRAKQQRARSVPQFFLDFARPRIPFPADALLNQARSHTAIHSFSSSFTSSRSGEWALPVGTLVICAAPGAQVLSAVAK